MRAKSVILAATVLATASYAAAAPLTFTTQDEIAGTTNYHVYLRASDYNEYTWETALQLSCNGNGQAWATLHYGSRYSGIDYEHTDVVTAKFDQDEPVDLTIRSFVAPPFSDRLRTASVLIVRPPYSDSTIRFSLSGSAEALAPFAEQCGI